MRIPAWEPLPGPVMVWPLRSRVTSLAVIVIQAPVLGFVQRFRFRPYVLGGFGIVNASSRAGEGFQAVKKISCTMSSTNSKRGWRREDRGSRSESGRTRRRLCGHARRWLAREQDRSRAKEVERGKCPNGRKPFTILCNGGLCSGAA